VFIVRGAKLERLPLVDEEQRRAGGGVANLPGASGMPGPAGGMRPGMLGGPGAGPAIADAGALGGAKDQTAAVREGIKKTGPEEYEIDRGMLDEQLQDLNKLSGQARVIPHYKDGRSDGFKLVGIRPGSLYSYIGIRSGDVLKRVNGEELNNPGKALALFEKLRSTSNLSVDVERRGANVTMTYNIK
jgi:general secretion pathway protein C